MSSKISKYECTQPETLTRVGSSLRTIWMPGARGPKKCTGYTNKNHIPISGKISSSYPHDTLTPAVVEPHMGTSPAMSKGVGDTRGDTRRFPKMGVPQNHGFQYYIKWSNFGWFGRTLIWGNRQLVGNLRTAERMLGACNLVFSGVVQGQILGFPTSFPRKPVSESMLPPSLFRGHPSDPPNQTGFINLRLKSKTFEIFGSLKCLNPAAGVVVLIVTPCYAITITARSSKLSFWHIRRILINTHPLPNQH
jgi:hypothetical protein